MEKSRISTRQSPFASPGKRAATATTPSVVAASTLWPLGSAKVTTPRCSALLEPEVPTTAKVTWVRLTVPVRPVAVATVTRASLEVQGTLTKEQLPVWQLAQRA